MTDTDVFCLILPVNKDYHHAGEWRIDLPVCLFCSISNYMFLDFHGCILADSL